MELPKNAQIVVHLKKVPLVWQRRTAQPAVKCTVQQTGRWLKLTPLSGAVDCLDTLDSAMCFYYDSGDNGGPSMHSLDRVFLCEPLSFLAFPDTRRYLHLLALI